MPEDDRPRHRTASGASARLRFAMWLTPCGSTRLVVRHALWFHPQASRMGVLPKMSEFDRPPDVDGPSEVPGGGSPSLWVPVFRSVARGEAAVLLRAYQLACSLAWIVSDGWRACGYPMEGLTITPTVDEAGEPIVRVRTPTGVADVHVSVRVWGHRPARRSGHRSQHGSARDRERGGARDGARSWPGGWGRSAA